MRNVIYSNVSEVHEVSRLGDERELLMIPGPTMVPPRVLRAMSQPMLSHVSQQFVDTFKESIQLTKELFMTRGRAFVLAGTGTLGMECAIANTVEPGDRVLCVENGFFGEKFKDIVFAHGGQADQLAFEWGKAVDPKLIEEQLVQHAYKAITVEHVDTSTGIANPVEKIGSLTKNLDTLCIVDSVCGLGGMPLKVDEWGIDICLSGSQKAIAAPPGITLLSVSDKAWGRIGDRETPTRSYYADLKRWAPVMDDPSKYFATPAVPLVVALRESLRIIFEEGLANRWRRHEIIAEAFRRGIQGMGLQQFPESGFRANTLSVPIMPEKISDVDIRRAMSEKHKVIVAGGLGRAAGKTIRIGHMGCVSPNDAVSTLSALEMSIKGLGADIELGRGLRAAEETLSQL